MSSLSAMPWVGGKSDGLGNQQRTGAWIASLLPPETAVTYCEPFAGMLGVMLQRAKSAKEIVNDLDGRVVNWWRAVRDYPDEMSRLIALTPHSRDEYMRARQSVASGEAQGVQAALDFTICILQGIASTPAYSGWKHQYKPRGGLAWRGGLDERIGMLAERMRDVSIEHRDACELLERTASYDETVIYVDPPYSAVDNLYSERPDHKQLTEALLAQRGRVAVSGYGQEWDHLGWERHEWSTLRVAIGSDHKAGRTEVLWTKLYFPPARLL